ncbi:MAG: hypothetical protein IT257_08350 [Chitinophagaceae bacterium]|nr:hypothetical protein [Chitinophagaceae bacterium]
MESSWCRYALILVLLVSACQSKQQHPVAKPVAEEAFPAAAKLKIDSCKPLLHNGCIVLRRGNDVISEMFSLFNKTDKTFSHCGIAFNENNTWYVYHSIGGEDNPDEKLRKDTYENFVIPLHNKGFGIYSLTTNGSVITQLHHIVDSLYARKVPFDMKFDLESNDRLYCAEMVYKSFQKASGNDSLFSVTLHNGFRFVSTDNIFVNKQAQMLCRVNY